MKSPLETRRRPAARGGPIDFRAINTQALLGDVSDNTVRRLVKTGRIEAVKVGARLMPRLASVRSFARGK